MLKEPKNIKEVIDEMTDELEKLSKEIELLNTMYKKIYLYKLQLENLLNNKK